MPFCNLGICLSFFYLYKHDCGSSNRHVPKDLSAGYLSAGFVKNIIIWFGILLGLIIGAEQVKTFKALARGKGGRFIGQYYIHIGPW